MTFCNSNLIVVSEVTIVIVIYLYTVIVMISFLLVFNLFVFYIFN